MTSLSICLGIFKAVETILVVSSGCLGSSVSQQLLETAFTPYVLSSVS